MTSQLPADNPLGYVGIQASNPGQNWFKTRDPLSTDYRAFSIGDRWINTKGFSAWTLVNKTAGRAYWSTSGAGMTSINADSGSVTPVLGAVNIQGYPGSGVSTQGSGNTLYINVSGQVGTGTTSGATTISLISIPMGSSAGTYVVSAIIAGWDATSSLGVNYLLAGAAKTNGSAATLIPGQALDEFEDVALTAATVSLGVSGNNFVINATGVAGETIHWRASISYTYTS
jgi:hypothetical protein